MGENSISVGDLVRPKGQRGAPDMTVVDVFTDKIRDIEMATCEFFDATGKPHSRQYPLAALERIKPRPPISVIVT